MTNELSHWGIKGMKWGRRRFQNADGSLTPAGRERYRKESVDLLSGKRERIDPTSSTASPRDFYRDKSRYTTAELKKINERFAAEKLLRNYMKEQMDSEKTKSFIGRGRKVLKSINATTKSVSEWVKVINDIDNTVQTIRQRHPSKNSKKGSNNGGTP